MMVGPYIYEDIWVIFNISQMHTKPSPVDLMLQDTLRCGCAGRWQNEVDVFRANPVLKMRSQWGTCFSERCGR